MPTKNNQYEEPKRYTAINDVTGALIKSRTDGQDDYSRGWDLIWKKKTIVCDNCCGLGWVETWGPEGEGSEDCTECKK